MKPMMCPRCRRLVGADESSCSWCGWKRPSRLRAALLPSIPDGDAAVRLIIGVNVACYVISLLLGPGRGFMRGLSPDRASLLLLGATGTVPIERIGGLWTLVSASYLHGGILHIIFNMMALRQIGPLVAQEYGVSRMFAIYTLGGAAGFWVSFLAGIPFTVGASASVCALIGSLLYFGKSRGGAYGQAVYREVTGWVVGLALFGLLVPAINNWGHGGGIVGGIVAGIMLGYGERRRENLFHRLLALACVALTLLALLRGAVGALALFV